MDPLFTSYFFENILSFLFFLTANCAGKQAPSIPHLLFCLSTVQKTVNSDPNVRVSQNIASESEAAGLAAVH